MLTKEQYDQAIKRQDECAERLGEITQRFDELDDELRELLLKLPQAELQQEYRELLPKEDPDPMVSFLQIIDFRLKNPELAAERHEQLNKYPEYQEYVKKRPEYDILKYQRYTALFSFYKMINDDRKALFDDWYTDLMDGLAERGLFTYFQQTPDFAFDEDTQFNPQMSVDEAERRILLNYTQLNYYYLNNLFKAVFALKTNNPLQISKTNDLAEALCCLKSGYYQSCARTMFALLENEHNNASSLYTRSTGAKRAEQIDEYVKAAGIDFYINAWQKIDAYYKKLNCDTDKMDGSIINRNDLIHGKYIHTATSDDCIRLILMYASFKEISFYMQQMIDFCNELMQDGLIALIKETEKTENKKPKNKKNQDNA